MHSASDKDRIKVLYIAGPERSGSTILGNILGEIDGFFFAGEVISIWKHLIDGGLCGCRASVKECEVWRGALNKAFGDMEQVDLQALDRLCRYGAHSRYVPQMAMLLVPWGRSWLRPRLKEHLDNWEKLYRAVQSNMACSVIVDSSKRPAYGYLLSLIPTIDLHVIHLVRDPRAVAYSWLRKKIAQEIDGQRVYMQQYSPRTSAIQWNKRNLIIEMFWRRSSGRYLMLNYRDFVREPHKTIERVLDLVQEKPPRLPFATEQTVQLGTNHSVRGNPDRFKTGVVKLRLDDEWQRKMKRSHKNLVTALTWPLLIRYGYLGGRKA